jgi:hypothetical protein
MSIPLFTKWKNAMQNKQKNNDITDMDTLMRQYAVSGADMYSNGGMFATSNTILGPLQAAQMGEDRYPTPRSMDVNIMKIETGYLVTINGKRYAAEKPTDVAERIIAVMVANKMESS